MIIATAASLGGSTCRSFDILSSRAFGLGGNIVLSQPKPSDLLMSPSGGLASGDWRIETGFARTFDLKDLDQAFFAAAGSYRSFTFAGGFSQLGQQDFYAERTAKLAVSYQLDSLTVGLTGSYFHLAFGGIYPTLHAFGVGSGVTWRTKDLSIALTGDNLNSPTLYDGAVPYRPLYSAEIELQSSRTLATLGRLVAQKTRQPQFGLGQRIMLGQASALTWGIMTAPVIFGGGFEFGFGRAALTYGASYHPVLGLSQTIAVSVGALGPKESNGGDFNR